MAAPSASLPNAYSNAYSKEMVHDELEEMRALMPKTLKLSSDKPEEDKAKHT